MLMGFELSNELTNVKEVNLHVKASCKKISFTFGLQHRKNIERMKSRKGGNEVYIIMGVGGGGGLNGRLCLRPPTQNLGLPQPVMKNIRC